MRSKDPLVIFLLLILSLAIAPAHGATPEERPFTWHEFEEDGSVRVNLYVFWSESCPHCHRALRFLGALEKELRWLEVQPLEVSSPEDVEAYSALAKKLGTDARYVPAFFYCGRAFQGYHDDYTTGRFLRESLEACHAELVALRGTDARSAGDQASASVEQPAAPEPAPINLLFWPAGP